MISDRGFAGMKPEKQRKIAAMGGKAAHIKGTAYEWTSEAARAAGRKGGLASVATRRAKKALLAAVTDDSAMTAA